MSKKDFFEKQSDGTSVKIKFYEDYIEIYLIKVLMHFGSCIISDLFCGSGRNGSEKGSPLILIEKAKKILGSKYLRQKHKNPSITIIFNDCSAENIESLKKELEKIRIPKNINIIIPQHSDFSDIMKPVEKNMQVDSPKFFFLDPFSYSNVGIEDLKKISNFRFAEILLFLPTFHARRFANSKNMPPKLRKFLENFTEKGVAHYEDIFEFNDSIKQKLKKELSIRFAQYGLIDIGASKNSLFLLTKSTKGAIEFNSIFWKNTFDGKSLKVKDIKYNEKFQTLFPIKDIPTTEYNENILNFKNELLQELKNRKIMTNVEITHFAVDRHSLPKHAAELLKELKKDGKIEIIHSDQGKKGFHVSVGDCDRECCIIKYIEQ